MPSNTGFQQRRTGGPSLISKIRNAPKAVRTVMQNFGWLMASRVVMAVFSLVYLAIITRSLGVSGFGRFALITGAAQLLANLLAFQTWQIIVQYGVTHAENGDEDKLARLYRGALLLDAVSAIAGIAAGALILHLTADALGMTPTLARATLIFNIIMLLSLRSTSVGILRLRDRFSLAAAAESALPTFRLIGALIAWFVHPKLQGFLIAWAISEMLTAAAHWYCVYKVGDLKLITGKGKDLRRIWSENPGLLQYSWSTNFSQSLNITVKQLPLMLVGGLTGTAAAGGFRLAAQLSRSLSVVSQLIARAAFPEIVRAVRNRGVSSLGNMIRSSLQTAAVVSLTMFVIGILFGRFVLEAVGGVEFGSAYYALLWLTAAACVDLATVAFEPSIMAAHRAQFLFLARLAATGLMVGGALLLEPVMGSNGVAAAVLGYSVCQAFLLAGILARMVRRNGPGSPSLPGN